MLSVLAAGSAFTPVGFVGRAHGLERAHAELRVHSAPVLLGPRPLDWLEVALERSGAFDWLESRLSKRRSAKSFGRRPDRIILVRHGESEGNTNKAAYSLTPDSQIALTERGWAQGTVAGLQIRKLVGDESVRFFYSPYMRARQTLLSILQAFDSQEVQLSSEPRLREQDFGNFQNISEMDKVLGERQKFGRFYYRFPDGEAGTDVFDRMASFITYMFRTMNQGGGYFDAPRRVSYTLLMMSVLPIRQSSHSSRFSQLPYPSQQSPPSLLFLDEQGAELCSHHSRAAHAHLLHVLSTVDGARV